MMTRKDYKLVASVMRTCKPACMHGKGLHEMTEAELARTQQWQREVRLLTFRLHNANENFDAVRFLEACDAANLHQGSSLLIAR